MTHRLSFLAPACALAACATSSPKSPTPLPASGTSAGTAAPAGIRAVDFMNFTYAIGCVDGTEIVVRDGSWSRAEEEFEAYFEVESVRYGDVDGDGAEEAIVVTNCNGGGSGQFTVPTLYTLRDGRAVELGGAPGGDRADGGISAAWIEDGVVVVERYAGDDQSGACCPVFIDTERWRWDGRALVQDGPATRRPVDEG